MFNKTSFDEDRNVQEVRNLYIFCVCLVGGNYFLLKFWFIKDIYNLLSYRVVCMLFFLVLMSFEGPFFMF